jgi:hypothetical protein
VTEIKSNGEAVLVTLEKMLAGFLLGIFGKSAKFSRGDFDSITMN